MAGFGGFIEVERERRLPRERAQPFAVVADEATQAPLRELELEQGKHCIGKRARRNEPVEIGSCMRAHCGQAHASLGDELGHQIGRDRVRAPQACFKTVKGLLVGRIEQHRFTSKASRKNRRSHVAKMVKAP